MIARRLAVATALTPQILVWCLVGQARAQELGGSPTLPVVHLTVTPTATSHQVCASGYVAATDSAPLPTWTFELVASTGFAPTPTVYVGRSFSHCETVAKTTAAGNHSETLTFAGGSNETPIVAAANGTWTPGSDNFLTTAP